MTLLTNTKNKNGFSLVEILIAMGVMSAMALVFSDMMKNQYKQLKILEAKQEVVNIKNVLLRTFGLSLTTGCAAANNAIGDLTFNKTTPPAQIVFNKIFDTAMLTPAQYADITTGFRGEEAVGISEMRFKNLALNYGDIYSADLEIKVYLSTLPGVGMKSIQIPNLRLKTVSTGSTAQIVSCSQDGLYSIKLLGAGTIQSSPSDCGNVICKPIAFQPGWDQDKITGSAMVYYDPGVSGSWGHYSFFFSNMDASLGTGSFCWDTGGDFTGCYGSEKFGWSVYGH